MTYTYDSHGADSQLNCRTGQAVALIRSLTEAEADLMETGPMYQVRFPDGYETAVFEDEIVELQAMTATACPYCLAKIELGAPHPCPTLTDPYSWVVVQEGGEIIVSSFRLPDTRPLSKPFQRFNAAP